MKPKSQQEVFDLVVNHLREQGCKSIGENGVCLYRGSNGTKCAVGVLIPDNLYILEMEGKSILELKTKYYYLRPRLYHSKLLMELQRVHDDYSTEEWEKRFEEVAKEFNLEYSAKA